MARPLRIEYPGAVYHLTARGNARQPIFRDDQDRERFLGTLDHVIARYGWRCHAYCLMTNHYHLLIETPKPTLARGMRQLNGVYTQAFNRRHRRVGHLFQGRYHAVVVEKEPHLLELCRYVVLNPVRVKACRTAGHWRWSSYRATAGLTPPPAFLRIDWLLGQFGQGQRHAQARYRTFVREGLGRHPWQDLRGQIYLGSEDFIARLIKKTERQQEVPRVQRQPVRPRLEEILHRRGDQGVTVAYRQYGYRLREIADHLGVHYATVSRRLRKTEGAGDV
jgi:REP element-mobilizing transposase RayT